MNRFRFSILALITMLLVSCGGAGNQAFYDESSSETYTNISVQELQTMFEDKDFVFVNVHIPFEGDIPNTDLSIPFDQIGQNLDQLPADKDAKIVLYCRSGNMSSIAAEALVDLGYTNIWNLEDGFNVWKQAGLPMVGHKGSQLNLHFRLLGIVGSNEDLADQAASQFLAVGARVELNGQHATTSWGYRHWLQGRFGASARSRHCLDH